MTTQTKPGNKPGSKPAPSAGSGQATKEAQAAEYEARAKADFNPEETARERYNRLKKEMAESLKAARKAARAEESVAFGQENVEEEVKRIVADLEKKFAGQTIRALSMRYSNPGNGKPVTVKVIHKMVKARVKS